MQTGERSEPEGKSGLWQDREVPNIAAAYTGRRELAMSKGFQDFIEAARRGGEELRVAEGAGDARELAAGAQALGYEFGEEEAEAYAARELTDEETRRVAAGAGGERPHWPIAIFP